MDRAIDDSVFEALFRQAVIDNFNEELDSLPPDEELARLYTLSAEHEARMQRLFAREVRRDRAKAAVKWSKRAVAVFVIAVTIVFGALMSVPQVRAAVVETITEWYEQFVRFTSNAPDAEKTNLEPGYIPEGFSEIVRDEGEMMTIIIYENDEMSIIFQSTRASDSISVDNENSNYERLLFKGFEYHVFDSTAYGGESAVVWDINGQRYTISAAISIRELLDIAWSIK